MKADAAMKVQCKTLPQFEYEKGEKKKERKKEREIFLLIASTCFNDVLIINGITPCILN